MAEKNAEHFINIQQQALRAEADDRKRGMIMGGALFFTLIAGAVLSIFVTDNPFIPELFLGTAAIGGIVAFIKGRNGS